MRRQVLALALVAGIAAGPQVLAQDGEVTEVVITAQMRDEYDPSATPAIVLKRRADNLITEISVICDTRDPAQRRAELRTTLRNLIRAAEKDPAIELGLGEEVVGRFDETMIDTIIGPFPKPDTEAARLIVKTRIQPGDTLDGATGRIKAFAKATPKAGRTEILLTEDWNLTLVRPDQYWGQIIDLVAKDSLQTAGAFGPGYGVQVEGLNLPVSWYQSGPLELSLFIPYKMTVRRGE